MPVGAKTFPFTTTVDCIGLRVSRAVPHGPRLTCNAIPVVSRPFTGWVAGESDPPLASFAITSTTLSFQLPAGHRLCFPVTLVGTHTSLAKGERGGESARLPVLCPQAVCCHRCQCCAGPPAGVVFRKLVSVCDFMVITGFFVVNLWFLFFCVFLSCARNWQVWT